MMNAEPESPQIGEVSSHAKERFRIGPVPAWVTDCPYADDFRGKTGDPVTQLLLSRQVHAESRQTHIRTAIRLETMTAVQTHSQWRLECESGSQLVILHTLKIRRGNQELNYTEPEQFRLLQREAGPEGAAVTGGFTLACALEDIRIGDILETSHTIETRAILLTEHFFHFFPLPAGVPVGKAQFLAWFAPDRPMKWKASSPDLKPEETAASELTRWVWSRDRFTAPGVEENTPEWYIAHPWIQVSDCADWKMVSAGVARAWRQRAGDRDLEELAKTITVGGEDLAQTVEKALRLVQDDYRNLNVRLDAGGRLPETPETVARRRAGDSQDLAFFLVHLLKRLGVPARPVLVHDILRKSVAELLPTPDAFNHALVEYELEGKKRWVDPTLNLQGGGPLNRMIDDFGVGLPLDDPGADLTPMPHPAADGNFYELRESFLLDTTGEASCLAVVVTARGTYADSLRREFQLKNEAGVAKSRGQYYTDRFTRAKRSSPLGYRDERENNEFVLAEVYDIEGFLERGIRPGASLFTLPTDVVREIIRRPEKTQRKGPFILGQPGEVTHFVEVQSTAILPEIAPQRKIQNEYFRLTASRKGLSGYLSVRMNLVILVDAIPARRTADYDKEAREVWEKCNWHLDLPAGHARPRRRSDFGELPASRRKTLVNAVPSSKPPLAATAADSPVSAKTGDPASPAWSAAAAIEAAASLGNLPARAKRPRRSGRDRSSRNAQGQRGTSMLLPAIIAIVLIIVIAVIAAATMHR